MKRTPHPARRARRITALVSGASYLGLTGSIAAATALSNQSEDVAADVPDVASDTTEGQQNLPLVLDGEATPASTTTEPEPTSSLDLFASSITTGAAVTASSGPATTPATTPDATASTTIATTRPPSTTATTTAAQATTVTTTASTLASTTTEAATTSSVATSASTEPTTTTTTEPATTTTTEATTTTTEATTTTSEAS